ncbi:hypothetical protein D3C81_1018170 [compost metagenome]
MHFGVDVRIAGIVLHGGRLATHVHQAYRQAAVGGGLQGARALQGAHVVDQAGTEARRFAHHRGGGGIHGNGDIQLAGDRLDGRTDPLQLLGLGDRRRTGTGRLATDIDQRRAGAHHRLGMPQGGIQPAVAAAIGERVGGDVEDAHHLWARQIERSAATGQPTAKGTLSHQEINVLRPGRRAACRRAAQPLAAAWHCCPRNHCRSRSSPWARAARGLP